MTTLNFSKLHATGNDFLVLADLEARFGPAGAPALPPEVRAALCVALGNYHNMDRAKAALEDKHLGDEATATAEASIAKSLAQLHVKRRRRTG